MKNPSLSPHSIIQPSAPQNMQELASHLVCAACIVHLTPHSIHHAPRAIYTHAQTMGYTIVPSIPMFATHASSDRVTCAVHLTPCSIHRVHLHSHPSPHGSVAQFGIEARACSTSKRKSFGSSLKQVLMVALMRAWVMATTWSKPWRGNGMIWYSLLELGMSSVQVQLNKKVELCTQLFCLSKSSRTMSAWGGTNGWHGDGSHSLWAHGR